LRGGGVRYFKREEFGDPDKIVDELVFALDDLREWLGKPIHIHCAWEDRPGYHGTGEAADIHIEGLSLIDQWIAVERFSQFNGIGLYPHWNNPGLHVDVRGRHKIKSTHARWGAKSYKGDNGKWVNTYVPLDSAFVKLILTMGV
jgi:hypothetical protein